MKLHRSPFLEWIQRPYGLKKALKSPKLAKMAFLPFHTFYLSFSPKVFEKKHSLKVHFYLFIHPIFSALVEGDYACAACYAYAYQGTTQFRLVSILTCIVEKMGLSYQRVVTKKSQNFNVFKKAFCPKIHFYHLIDRDILFVIITIVAISWCEAFLYFLQDFPAQHIDKCSKRT